MDLEALIFDVDGTLAETEEVHRAAFNGAFREAGLPWVWDRDLYRRLLLVSGGRERMRAFAAEADPARLDDGFTELAARLHHRKTALYTEAVGAGAVPLRPGVTALLREARAAGVRCAVATTTSRANVVALLDGATGGEGHGWFETLVCAEDAPVKKPAPDVYLEALARLGLPPAACLALEDSVNGVGAATAAGIAVVVSESIYTAGDDFTGARAVMPDFFGLDLAAARRLHAGG